MDSIEELPKRIIKFRAWCTVDEMMYCDIQSGIKFDDGSVYGFHNFLDPYPNGYHNWRLMQFTGLLDKNGKEIYEGDILDLHPDENDKVWHRKIIWDTAAFHCVQIHGKANYPLHFNKHTPDKMWVIIGNVFQNPELL